MATQIWTLTQMLIEQKRVAHRLICMVSLVILKCINLVIQLANNNKVN